MDDNQVRDKLWQGFRAKQHQISTAWRAYTSGETYTDDEGDEYEDAADYLRQHSTDVEVRPMVTIMLEGGGPTAWLEVLCDSDGDADRVDYIAAWSTVMIRHNLNPHDDGLGTWAATEAERHLQVRRGNL